MSSYLKAFLYGLILGLFTEFVIFRAPVAPKLADDVLIALVAIFAAGLVSGAFIAILAFGASLFAKTNFAETALTVVGIILAMVLHQAMIHPLSAVAGFLGELVSLAIGYKITYALWEKRGKPVLRSNFETNR